MFGLTPAEITLLISALSQAIQLGEAAYEAWQLKDMADLQAKLTAQLADAAKDRATANADIDARDKALEQDLAKK